MTATTDKKDRRPSRGEYFKNGTDIHLDDVYRETVGKCIIPANYRKSWQKKRDIKALTAEISRKLEDAGVSTMTGANAWQDKNGVWHGLVMVTNVTQEVRPVGRLRNLNVLPEKAVSNRKEVEADLLAWLQRPENNNAKYFVVAAGKRNKITYSPENPDCDCLSQRYSRFRGGLNYWAKNICKKFNVEVDFLGFEFPRNNLSQYHLHANVVLRMPFLEEDEYDEFIAKTEKYFGTKLQDEGVIKDEKRFARYPFKIETLGEISAEELAWLHHQTQGKKLSQPVGKFKNYRAELKKEGLKSVMKDDTVYRCSKTSNVFFPRPKPADGETDAKNQKKSESKKRPAPVNILISRMNPGSFVSPVIEGAAVMLGYDPNATDEPSLFRLAELRKLQRKDRELWEHRGAPRPYEAKALHDLFTTIPEDDLYDSYRDGDGNRRKLTYREVLENHTELYNEFLVARAEEYGEAIVVLYDTTTGNQNKSYSKHNQIDVLEDHDPPPKSSKREVEDFLAIFDKMDLNARNGEKATTSQEAESLYPDFLAIFDGDVVKTDTYHFRGALVQRDVVESTLNREL